MIEDTSKLDKLYLFLSYEVKSSILILLLWIPMMFFLVAALLVLAAALFTPYLLYVLNHEKKNGWIAAFVLTVLVPLALFVVLAPKLFFLFLLPFYFYCYVLRMVVKDWIQEKNAKNNLYLQKIESQKRKLEEENFDYLIQK